MKWTITDPDNYQYMSNGMLSYTFKEFNRTDYPEVFKELADGTLEHTPVTLIGSTIWKDKKYWSEHHYYYEYTLKELANILDSYGYTLNQLAEMENNQGDKLLYECIFEHEIDNC